MDVCPVDWTLEVYHLYNNVYYNHESFNISDT